MKIVVPLDLSDTALQALEPAAEIAQALGDELHLMTVEEPKLRNELRDLASSEHARISEVVSSYLVNATAGLTGIETSTAAIGGDDAAEALIEYADRDESVRMIAIASHGRSGIERWRLGSVAERLVRHSTVPVLVIPARHRSRAD
jgi:nucleotide-binding universal stress UspA family protein